jgi:glycine/sarcosine N-methyltransferase
MASASAIEGVAAAQSAESGALTVPDDAYAGIADRYDLFHGRFGDHDSAAVPFFASLFSNHGVKSVLDCACGTGRHLHLFHTLGFNATGSDISPAMLEKARGNLRSAGVDVPLVLLDFRCLEERFSGHFDAVVCLSSSILHMENDHQVVLALRSMRGAVKKGGLVVLSQGTTDKQWAAQPRFILAVDEPDFTRIIVIDYHGSGARYNIVDVSRAGSEPRLDIWGVDYARMLLCDDYRRLLGEAGFLDVALYGSYGREPYDPLESDLLIVVARN